MKRTVIIISIAAVIIIAGLCLVILGHTGASEGSDNEGGTAVTPISAVSETSPDLPSVENSQGLKINSVYTASITNPDCGYEYGEEIAALEIVNGSDCYLVSAELTAQLSDGSQADFTVTDLPSGDIAETFDINNQTVSDGVSIVSVTCNSEEYLAADEVLFPMDKVSFSVDGYTGSVTNTSGEAIDKITVVYRCDMAGSYLGGVSYTAAVKSLEPDETYEFEDESILGEIKIVRIVVE